MSSMRAPGPKCDDRMSSRVLARPEDLGLPEALYTGLGIQVGQPFFARRIVTWIGTHDLGLPEALL